MIPAAMMQNFKDTGFPEPDVWAHADAPHVQKIGEYVNIVDARGRSLLVEQELLVAWGKCGKPLGETGSKIIIFPPAVALIGAYTLGTLLTMFVIFAL